MARNNTVESDKEASQYSPPSPGVFVIFAQLALCFVNCVGGATIFTCLFLGQVVKEGVVLLRKPLAFIVCLWALVHVALFAFNSTIHAPLKAVSLSLCALPFVQAIGLCLDGSGPTPLNVTDFLGLVEAETQKIFETLLDQNTVGSELSLKIKKAEYAASESKVMVKFSGFENKNLLTDAIMTFCQSARGTAKDLQSFSSQVAGSIDQILAYHIYALHAMNAPRSPTISSPSNIGAEDTVSHVYSEVTTVLLDHAATLIQIADSLLTDLESLDEQLELIYELVFEEQSIAFVEDHPLSRLWTKLGGNRQGVWDLKLLNGIGEYQRKAKAYVGSVLQTLDAVKSDLDGLHKNTSNLSLVGSTVSIKAQIEGIGYGIQRLRNVIQVIQRSEPKVALTLEERH